MPTDILTAAGYDFATPTRRSRHRHAALCLATTVLIIGRLLDWRDRWDPR